MTMNAQVAKGMKAVWVESNNHKELKILAAINEVSVQELANLALAEYIKKHGGE